jgi:hypothetical protein
VIPGLVAIATKLLISVTLLLRGIKSLHDCFEVDSPLVAELAFVIAHVLALVIVLRTIRGFV